MTAAYRPYGWVTPTFIPPADADATRMPVVLVASDGTTPDPRRVQADLIEAWRSAGRPVIVAVSVFGVPTHTAEVVRRWVGLHEFAGVRFRKVTTRPANVEQVITYRGQVAAA